jgi:hypothetical protein
MEQRFEIFADCFQTAAPIKLAPGAYAASIGYKGLGTLSEDGLDGDDSSASSRGGRDLGM